MAMVSEIKHAVGKQFNRQIPHTLQCLQSFLVPLQLGFFLLYFCFQVCLV